MFSRQEVCEDPDHCHPVRRTYSNEFRQLTNKLQRQNEDASPERVIKLMKKNPPFSGENMTQRELDTFNLKGKLGWQYLSRHILSNSKALHRKLEQNKKGKARSHIRRRREQLMKWTTNTLKRQATLFNSTTLMSPNTSSLSSAEKKRSKKSPIHKQLKLKKLRHDPAPVSHRKSSYSGEEHKSKFKIYTNTGHVNVWPTNRV